MSQRHGLKPEATVEYKDAKKTATEIFERWGSMVSHGVVAMPEEGSLSRNADFTQLANILFLGEFGQNSPMIDILRIGVDPVVGVRTPVAAIATQGECHRGYEKLSMTELAGSASTADKMLRKGFTSGPYAVPMTLCSAPFEGVDKKDANGETIPKGRGVLNNTNKGVLGVEGLNPSGFCISRTRDPQSDCFEGIVSESEGGTTCGSDQAGAFHSMKIVAMLTLMFGFQINSREFKSVATPRGHVLCAGCRHSSDI